MLWFIPTTHKVVIAGLLVIAAVAFVLFWVTRLAARRQDRRAEPHETPRAPFRGDPGVPPPAAPPDE